MPTSRRAAVLGSPIAHSLSPVLHRAAYAALELDGWRYDAHDCDEAALPGFVDRLGPEWAGLSLTMPLKRVALDVADEVSPLAAATGAANTLVLRGGRRFADNTDVAGLIAALRGADRTTADDSGTQRQATSDGDRTPTTANGSSRPAVALGGERIPPTAGSSGRRAVVLGAGGTAQAALAALRELGISDVAVLVRAVSRAVELRSAAERLGVAPTVDDALADPSRAAIALSGADIVISTLPAGAADHLGGSVPAAAVVLDVVYAPWPTPFAATAATRGARVVSGLEMLLHQAVAQVELMTGRPGPVAPMRAALDAAVRTRPSPT